MSKSVLVKAPATTANMGPGFDCLGMALDIWNTVSVEEGASGIEIEISGEGKDELPRDESNLTYRSFALAYEEVGASPPPVRMRCDNAIPLARGLGSSAAAVAGGLLAGSELSGANLSRERLLALAAEIEGHPDNAAAAVMGGCQIVARTSWREFVTAPVAIPPEISAVLFVPDVPMSTEEARGFIFDEKIEMRDVIFSLSRVALLVNAFASGDLRHLAIATEDVLHQPARQTLFRPMRVIFRAALAAGALGVFLSGAGSSILALAREREYTIGYEMADAAAKAGVEGVIKVVKPTPLGAQSEAGLGGGLG